MYQALYRKYRPQTFDDLVGQLAISQTLKNQLQNNKCSHAYLFTGSRGTGKTTSARILAKAVNCENPVDGNPCNRCAACQAIDSGACMDVLEIDAASNNGVDNVRDLRDDAIYLPSQVKMRVYIIDEVHMLSGAAFNALLKILEEPPEHLLFILATTELHKVPATILSRCQRFAFRRISQEDIAARLQYVAYQENIELDDSAARVLARLADGGMRDGLSLLDQCATATTGELTAEKVYACLGIAGIQDCGRMLQHIADKDTAAALSLLNRFYVEGKDMGALMDELSCLVRDLMVLKAAPKEGISLLSGVASDEQTKALSNRFSHPELVRFISLIQSTVAGFTRSTSKRLDAEMCIVNMCLPELSLDPDALNARISHLEEQLAGGFVSAVPVQSAAPTSAPKVEEEPAPAEEKPVEAPPAFDLEDTAPAGFWSDVAEQVYKSIKPPYNTFFTPVNAPVKGVLKGDRLVLVCETDFAMSSIKRADILETVQRKASAKLGRPVSVVVSDGRGVIEQNDQMEKLLRFGAEHSDIVRIKEN